MNSELRDVTGFRGERIVEIRLTEFHSHWDTHSGGNANSNFT
jgi:hypothetical protein